MKNGFNLTVRDREDLAIMSAAFQDAIVRVGDLTYLPKRRRFVGVVNRFKWEDRDGSHAELRRESTGRTASFSRIRTGFHFDSVQSVLTRNILQDRKEGVLELLAIQFDGDGDRGGKVELIFSGGGTIVLEVECLEASFQDIGQAWATPNLPRHGVTNEPNE